MWVVQPGFLSGYVRKKERLRVRGYECIYARTHTPCDRVNIYSRVSYFACMRSWPPVFQTPPPPLFSTKLTAEHNSFCLLIKL